ncbi:DEAD/DEAH box helicase family protein [Patescibacteria group bacterium]|nr:DEAD/DEAH box helicase family protein [Patescibacteria group bacterium]
MSKDFFPQKPDIEPIIYAYELEKVASHKGLLKVGFSARGATIRADETTRTLGVRYKLVFDKPAIRNDGTSFTDNDIHKILEYLGFPRQTHIGKEWFRCTLKDVEKAYKSVVDRKLVEEDRIFDFKMRPEQKEAVEKTARYFENYKKENPNKTPHFLWNAKMRFGKTFTSYQLALKMGWKKILVMTFKPAVENAWEDDLKGHVDFKGWQFVSASKDTLWHEEIDMNKPYVCFGSFQDYLGRNKSTGGIKTKNEWVHATNWDLVIFDEYHYGAWRENAKELFESEDEEKVENKDLKNFKEEIIPITTSAYLYLSGTPFRAIASGEFIEEQIYNWTYSDEQKAKESWDESRGQNPYASLPRIVMMTYQLPDSIIDIASQGEFNEFDLNEFFSAEGEGDKAKFKYEDEVQKWLDMIRGAFLETAIDNLKLGAKKPPLPYSHAKLLNVLNHTIWFLPSVASCYAMANLLKSRQNIFYQGYKVIVSAGVRAGVGLKALPPVLQAMEDPLKSKTITLTCGKLMTGVTVRPWTGIFMLKNLSTPETYFQAAFRVQSPWTIKNPDDKSPNREEIIKKECYIFDFAPNRALSQIADYSCRLDVSDTDVEKKVEEFISFLPVLAYDGSVMKQIDASGILDIAMSGTTATLLARRWESALLVNVDNNTLRKLMNNEEAMNALMSIEGFRRLNQDLETIINKSEAVDRIKKEANDRELTKKEKKELTEEEKEYKSLRKQVQEKLIKFATRIPVFMYLTDYRERTLKDVITKLEPGLFKKVTGLTQKDFEMLVSLGVFNGALMNDAVYKFKRYEDASLRYAGIDKHEGDDIGLYDTVITAREFKDQDQQVFENEVIS